MGCIAVSCVLFRIFAGSSFSYFCGFRFQPALLFLGGGVVLLLLGVFDAHADDFVPYGHNGVTYEHSRAGAVHDFHERLVGGLAEALIVAVVAKRLGDAVFAMPNLQQDVSEKRRAFRTKLSVLRVVVRVAVNGEGGLDVRFFFGPVFLQSRGRIFFLAEPLGEEFLDFVHEGHVSVSFVFVIPIFD